MQRIVSGLFLCLLLTACTVGIVEREALTPGVSVLPTPTTAAFLSVEPSVIPTPTHLPSLSPMSLPTPSQISPPTPASIHRVHGVEPVARHLGGSETAAIFAQEDYAYVIYKNYEPGFASAREELAVLDISDPARPVQVYFESLPGAEKVYISGDYVYITTLRNCETGDGSCDVGLRIQNFGLESQVVRGVYSWFQIEHQNGERPEIAVGDRTVYVATPSGGLSVLDVSDPGTPVLASFLEGHAYAVAAAGKYVYVLETVDWNEWYLRILDVSTPTAPVEVGHSQSFEWSKRGADPDMGVVGKYIYVADWYGLHVMDISDPTAPAQVGFYATPELARDGAEIAVANGYVYVAGVLGGLWVLDVSDPTIPTEVAFYDLQAVVWDVAVVDDYIYVVCPMEGIYILRHIRQG